MSARAPILAALLAAAACGDSSAVRQVALIVDVSSCKPGCTIARYSIWVHRALGGGQRCALHAREVQGTIDERFEPPADPVGDAFYAGAAAWCAGQSSSPSLCCDYLGQCLPTPDKLNVSCTKAVAACPAEGDPFGATAATYYAEKCKASGGAGDCVVCQGESELLLGGDEKRAITLSAVSGCANAIPKAATCP